MRLDFVDFDDDDEEEMLQTIVNVRKFDVKQCSIIKEDGKMGRSNFVEIRVAEDYGHIDSILPIGFNNWKEIQMEWHTGENRPVTLIPVMHGKVTYNPDGKVYATYSPIQLYWSQKILGINHDLTDD